MMTRRILFENRWTRQLFARQWMMTLKPQRVFLLWLSLSLCLSVSVAETPNADPYPVAAHKKGLQVQMIDDALQLGVAHAALNVDLTRLIDPTGEQGGPHWTVNGRQYFISPAVLAGIDAQVRPLSEQQVIVTLILLTYHTNDPLRRDWMLHPGHVREEPHAGPIAMFNTATPTGREALQACIEFLAARYSSEQGHGRVWGYICGNEVNSHWFWANMGRATPEQVVAEYEQAVRLIHQSVRKHSRNARVYLSLDHFWNERYPVGDEQQCLGGREFLVRFAAQARAQGDFDWHVAYHPYPEPLTEPRFWRDEVHSAPHDRARCITFRNLQVLTDFLHREEFQFAGRPRRVILSEQGFHCNENRPQGEQEQAAAFALAYKLVASLPGIDAFILHRHTDHAHEGGLNLGLWTNRPGHACSPDRPRMMYDVFRAAGTSEEDAAFAFALPILEATDWNAALRNLRSP